MNEDEKTERESFENVMGQPEETRPEEMVLQPREGNTRRVTRNSTRSVTFQDPPKSSSKVLRKMHYNPIASNIIQQTTEQHNEVTDEVVEEQQTKNDEESENQTNNEIKTEVNDDYNIIDDDERGMNVYEEYENGNQPSKLIKSRWINLN